MYMGFPSGAMMGYGAGWLTMILVWVLLALAIAALIKYIGKK